MEIINKNLAQIILSYCLDLTPGQNLLISTTETALPLAKEIYKLGILEGLKPEIDVRFQELDNFFIKNGTFEQLTSVPLTKAVRYRYSTAFLNFPLLYPPIKDEAYLNNYNINRTYSLQFLNSILNYREANESVKWLNVYYPSISDAFAMQMSLVEANDFFFKAMLLHLPSPLQQWLKVREYNQRLINYLKKVETLHFKGPDVDLLVNVKGRTWVNAYGENNFPNGEVFTSPIEESAVGYIKIKHPFIYRNQQISGLELTFEAGKVISFQAKIGYEFLKELFAKDTGSSYLGEIAFGTNPGIPYLTNSILLNEKKLGTFHIALGDSYDYCGGKNSSQIHLDLVYDLTNETLVLADGETIFANGSFLI